VSGQLVTGSFMDYGMPRAHDMPIELREASMWCLRPAMRSRQRHRRGRHHAAIAAVMNAVSNAIRTAPPITWKCRRRRRRSGSVPEGMS